MRTSITLVQGRANKGTFNTPPLPEEAHGKWSFGFLRRHLLGIVRLAGGRDNHILSSFARFSFLISTAVPNGDINGGLALGS